MVRPRFATFPNRCRGSACCRTRARGGGQTYLLGVLEREAAGQENRRLLEKWAEKPLNSGSDIDFVELVRSQHDGAALVASDRCGLRVIRHGHVGLRGLDHRIRTRCGIPPARRGRSRLGSARALHRRGGQRAPWRVARRRELDRPAFTEAVRRLAGVPLDVWPVRPLLPRMVELASNATAYDAAYLALAERLSVSILTGDAKLVGVPGVRCSFIAVS